MDEQHHRNRNRNSNHCMVWYEFDFDIFDLVKYFFVNIVVI